MKTKKADFPGDPSGTSFLPMVKNLPSKVGGLGSIPGQGTKMTHAVWCSQLKKKEGSGCLRVSGLGGKLQAPLFPLQTRSPGFSPVFFHESVASVRWRFCSSCRQRPSWEEAAFSWPTGCRLLTGTRYAPNMPLSSAGARKMSQLHWPRTSESWVFPVNLEGTAWAFAM